MHYWGFDTCRAIAVFLVFFVHFTSVFFTSSPNESAAQILYQIGHGGVDLFFVLSGFLLYQGFIKRPQQPLLQYVMKRGRRLMPAYWVALVIYITLFYITKDERAIELSAQDALTLLKNVFLLAPILGEPPLVTVSWTLTFEWAWYLFLPLCFALRFHRLNQRFRQLILLSVFTTTGIYFGAYGGPEQIGLFFVGAFLGEIRAPALQKHTKALICSVSAFAIIFAAAIYESYLSISILLSGIGWSGVLYVALTTHGQHYTDKLGVVKGSVFLGKISYSFYLLHGLCIHATHKLLQSYLNITLSAIVSFTLSVIVAYLSYRFIEQRFLMRRGEGEEKARVLTRQTT